MKSDYNKMGIGQILCFINYSKLTDTFEQMKVNDLSTCWRKNTCDRIYINIS